MLWHHFGYKAQILQWGVTERPSIEMCTTGYGVLEKLKYQNIIWSLSLYFHLLPVSQALPVTGQVLYFLKRAHQVIPYHLRKTVWQYLKSAARKVVMLVTILKKYLIN